MAVSTLQQKPSTEKVNVAEQAPASVEKKPSTNAQSVTRQPAFTTAMNSHVPLELAGPAVAGPHVKPIATHETAPEPPASIEAATLESAPAEAVSAEPPPSAAPASAGPPAKPKVRTSASDPRFQKVMTRLDQSASKTKKHPPATKKVAEAHAAAEPPKNARMAQGKAHHVAAMKQAETKKPDQQSFLDLLLTTIDKNIPETVGDAKNFLNSEGKQKLKGSMAGTVKKEETEAAGNLEATAHQEPDVSGTEEKVVRPLPTEKTSAPAAIGAADAVPAPKEDSEVSLQHSKEEAECKLKDAQVTPDQLKEANDPRFTAVLTAKDAVDKHADTAPQKYRSDEEKILTQETAKAVADEKHGLSALEMVHDKSGSAVKLSQMTAKAQEEARRKEVTDNIEKIYAETKQAVESKLGSLEQDVTNEFDKGVATALANMKTYVQKHLDEYSGFMGLLRRIEEWVAPLPPEVKDFYRQGREHFKNELHQVVVRIAAIVDMRLKEAKDEITRGQQRIQEYVQHLPRDLKEVGLAAEREVNDRFDTLRRSVDDKKHDLAQKLAQRYHEAGKKADDTLKQIQEDNKGWLTKLGEKLAEVAKILGEFRDRVSNMLKAGRDTILLIVAHPIDFLKHLIDAIKQGVSQFVDNIVEHLKAGFLKWLFGTLENAGIQVPKDFSLGSILKLILQILGITYEKMRAKAVKYIGEGNMVMIEKVGKFLYTLITSGPEALWEQIKEFLGNLKEMVIDAIQSWVETALIKAAVVKLLSLFNPVGAIIQAIMAIYNTVMFFIERINQILAFVEAIINSVHKIAIGAIGDAANWIEKALANMIPLLIGFLARLLGLGNISEEIQNIIKKIQAFVDKAIDKLIEKAVKFVKGLFGKGEKEDETGDVREKAQKQLMKQLKTKHNKQQVQEIVGQVFGQLQSQGLKRLEVGQENEDGSYPILAEASPLDPIAVMRLARENASVKMAATLTFSTPQTLHTARKFGETRIHGVLADTTSEGSALVYPGQHAPQTEQEAKEGTMRAKSKVFQLASWNTGNPDENFDSNKSHAETQFMEWFTKEISQRQHLALEKIQLHISESPCSFCAVDLCSFMKTEFVYTNLETGEPMRHSLQELIQNQTLEVTLSYEKPHNTGKHPTTVEDIKDIQHCKITVIPLGERVTLTRANIGSKFVRGEPVTGQWSRSSSHNKG